MVVEVAEVGGKLLNASCLAYDPSTPLSSNDSNAIPI